MSGEPPHTEHSEPAEGPLDPAPGSLQRTSTEPPERNGAVDGLVDAGARVLTPFIRLGLRTARGVGRRLGLNDAVRHQVDRALDSDTAARTTQQMLESDAANQVWDKVLESQQAQKLVERVAEAPEVRSAITSQGIGLLEDVRQTARRAARRLDDELERLLRKARRRAPRAQRPIYAGGGTRLLAIGFDAAVLSGILLLLSGLLALLVNAVFSYEGDNEVVTIALGVAGWWLAAGIYLGLFWILAERTPGMTFFALRISTESGGRVGPRQDIRRLIGFALALIPFGLGFLGILTNEKRRGWHDRFGNTVVLYADPELDSGLPGWTPAAGPAVKPRAIRITPELVPGAAQAAAAGFLDNEIWVWMLRRDRQRRRLLPRHYRAMIRRVYIPRGGAWTTEDTAGAALWFPPNTLNMTAGERLAEVSSLLPGGLDSFPRALRWEELISKHHPRKPHWYLQTLSVEPASQRRGVGTALMEPGLARADADGVGAYLETQRRDNIPYYQRFGFELTDEISLHDSPPVWLMWRNPTSGA